ncbi:MAG: ferritin-like domain-containing protein [Longimicrobiales bacterium]
MAKTESRAAKAAAAGKSKGDGRGAEKQAGGSGRRALLEGLNEDLAHEYEAIISYLLYSRMVDGPMRPDLSGFLEGEIADELEHAKFLAHKIVALGGTPTTEPAAVELPADNRGMLERSLKSERDTIRRYTERIEQAEAAGELGLKVDLEAIVAQETQHKEDLERMLHGWKRG